jgi:DNA-binding XRE family transcriptional regulator
LFFSSAVRVVLVPWARAWRPTPAYSRDAMGGLVAVTLGYWCGALMLGLLLTLLLREIFRSRSPAPLGWPDAAAIGLCVATSLALFAAMIGTTGADVAGHVFVGFLLPSVFGYFDMRKPPSAVQRGAGATTVIGQTSSWPARDGSTKRIPSEAIGQTSSLPARDGTTKVIAAPANPEPAVRSPVTQTTIEPRDDELRTVIEAPDHPHDATLAELGRRVGLARRSGGLLTDEAAARAGVSPEHWRKLEAGTWNPTVRTLIRVAEVLGVTARDLIG